MLQIDVENMDIALIILVVVVVFYFVRNGYQKRHIQLLGSHLAKVQIEKNMQSLYDGYARALKETEPVRRQQIWELQEGTERAFASQLQQVAAAFAKENEQDTRISKLSFCIPYIEKIGPSATRDFRAVLQVHAQGVARVVQNEAQWSLQDKAYCLMAEILLMQHSCHWFCKSRNVANARLVMRHQVTFEKVLDSVSEQTRRAYQDWLAQ